MNVHAYTQEYIAVYKILHIIALVCMIMISLSLPWDWLQQIGCGRYIIPWSHDKGSTGSLPYIRCGGGGGGGGQHSYKAQCIQCVIKWGKHLVLVRGAYPTLSQDYGIITYY